MSDDPYYDGDYSAAVPIGALVSEQPFQVDAARYVFKQKYHQLAEDYTALALGASLSSPFLGSCYFAKDSDLRDSGVGGIVEFERTGVLVPAIHDEFADYAFQRQFIVASGSSLDLVLFNGVETARFHCEFFRVASGQTYEDPKNIPILTPYRLVKAQLGGATLYYRTGTAPGGGDTEFVGGASTVSHWMAGIYQRRTPYVKINSSLTEFTP